MSAAIFFARYWKQIIVVFIFLVIAGTIAFLYIKTRNQEADIIALSARIEGYEKTLKKVESEISAITQANREHAEIETEKETGLIRNKQVLKQYKSKKQEIERGVIYEKPEDNPEWIVLSRLNELFHAIQHPGDRNKGAGLPDAQSPGAGVLQTGKHKR